MDSEQQASTATVMTTSTDDDKRQSKTPEVDIKKIETEVKEIAQKDNEEGSPKSTEQETPRVETETIKEPPEVPEIINSSPKKTTDSSKSTIEDIKETIPLNKSIQPECNSSTSTECDNVDSKVPVVIEQTTRSGRDKTPSPNTLSSLPGTLQKYGPGIDDVEIVMDSSSLLDRVILYSLKNTMPDNKRLDAAKNKIINGNLNSFNSNSSDSNSSNKSIIEDSKPRSAVDKIIEEFKGNSSSNSSSGGSGNGNGSAKGLITGANTLRDSSKSPEAVKSVETSKPVILVVEDLKLASDISNGADNSKSNCNLVNEVKQIEPNVISTTLVAVEPTIKRSETPAYVVTPTNIQQVKEISSNPDLKIRQSPVGYSNEALDFREMKPEVPQQPETMLDLSIPNKSYDDKKVPIIKRNHALYVGLPDFSKQIFSEPTVSRADPAMGSLKVPNPDFSTMQRAPELQMRHPDFTKSFNESAATSSSSVSVTPSNFVEIARKNNYISDLQLKTPAAASPSSSYKIDFRPTSKLEVTTKTGTPSISPYPNMKKEGISAYNQQQNQLSDEPMAHIINKSHFLPVTREEKTEYQKPPQVPAPIIPSGRVGGWNDRIHASLLGGSAQSNEKPIRDYPSGHQYSSSSSGSTYYPQVPEKKPAKNPHDNYPGLPPGPTAPNHTPSAFYMHGPQEDLRKYNPAHYPYKDSGTYSRIVENLERQEQHEFSLKQKEQLLRQEGTIITIKNEPPTPPAPIASQSKPVSSSTSSRESYGSHSADLYRDMKLKQMNHEYTHPKESLPNVQHQTARRVSDPIPYHQQYPDFPGTNQQYSKNYRYEPLKGAFKMVEQQNKSPAPSLVYPHPDAIRHSQQIKQTTSPGMHAQGQPITKQENFYGSSGSSKSYGSPSPVHLVKSPHSLPPTPALMKSIDGQMNPPQNWPPPGATIRLSSNPPGQPMSSPSPTKYLHQSQPKMSSSPLHQIKQSPSPHQAYPGYQPQGKYTQSYPPVKGMEAKDVYGRPAPQQGYYAQPQPKYPESKTLQFGDFSRQFENDPSRKLSASSSSSQENLQRYPVKDIPSYYPPAQQDLRHSNSDQNLNQYQLQQQQQQQQQQQHQRAMMQEAELRNREVRYHANDSQSSRYQEHPTRGPTDPPRMYSQQQQPSASRLEHIPAEISVVSKVKVEPKVSLSPAIPVQRELTSTSVIKTFVEVKKESPLDLSVKTIKTKADSTGDDYGAVASTSRRQRPEPSGLKVEFTPNFASQGKTDCRQQARMGPHEYPTNHRIAEANRPTQPPPMMPLPGKHYKLPNEAPQSSSAARIEYIPRPEVPQNYGRPPSPQMQVPVRDNPSSSRPYMYPGQQLPPPTQRYHDMERPHAPLPSVSNPQINHYERPIYPIEMKTDAMIPEMHRAPGHNYEHPMVQKIEEARTSNNHHQQPFYPPNHKPAQNYNIPGPAAAAYPVINKPQHSGSPVPTPEMGISGKSAKPGTTNAGPPGKDQSSHLYWERVHDRKYVEDILYGRKRKDPSAGPPDRNNQRESPPKKRTLDQNHSHGSLPPKYGKHPDEHHRMMVPEPGTYNPQQSYVHYERQQQLHPNHPGAMDNQVMRTQNVPPPMKPSPVDTKYYPNPRYTVKDQVKPPPLAPQSAYTGQYYPNPKAEMIHRSDLSSGASNFSKYQPIKEVQQPPIHHTQYQQANFYPRPDDVHFKNYNASISQRINHQPMENIIKNDQLSGPPVIASIVEQPQKINVTNGMLPGSSLTNANSGSNGNIPRGADQNTIIKLRNNLEKRELQKLRTQKSIEISEDDNQSNQKQDLSPRQFRTKAELKGFNAADYPATVATVEPTVDNKIKLPEPERPAAPSAFDLMDWGSACNDFVEQLQTGKKRAKKKRTGKKGDDAKLEVVDKPVPLSDIPGTTTNDLSEVPIDIVKSINNELKPEVNGETSSDEDKPLLHLLNPQMLRNVIISRTALVEKISEKISRNMREKQRLEQEQKLIARLGKPSSSESESEARRPVRTLKRVRRLRKRAALGMRKTSDEEEEEEEEEATDDDKKLVNKRQKTGTGMESSDSEEAVVKRKISRNISKLEEMTSSEEDSPMKKSKDDQKTSDKKSSTDQKQQKDEKCEKSPGKKSCNSKLSESKKQISSSESEESDDDGKNNKDKKSKSPAASSSSAKLKKLKSLRDGMLGAKTLLKEEETMTRSKRKLENEKKFANSKVLRNEKVVHNIAPDKKVTKSAEPIPSSTSTLCRKSKRKDSTKLDDVKRKILDTDSDDTAGKLKKKVRRVSKLESSSSDDESEEHEEEVVVERLRPRKIKPAEPEKPQKDSKKKLDTSKTPDDKTKATESGTETPSKPTLPCKIPIPVGMEMPLPFHYQDKSTKFAPGWEQDTYNFKRSLKVPAGLITLSRPPLHGISHSLPDLDQQSSDTSEIFSDFVRAKDLEKKAIEAKKTEELPAKGKKKTLKDEKVDEQQKKPGSMIELLHQRVVQSKKRFKTKKAAGILPSSLTKSHPEKSDDETLDKESDKVLGLKKNIFETSVIKSRTRTENKAIRSKEIIREVFGSEDRPASAPPLGLEQISFDQKYREYLDKMNVGLPEKLVSKMPVKLESKHEDDDDDDDEEEDNENVINDKESSFGDTLTLPASERDLVTPLPLKIKKKGRGIRTGKRKGSSGFDYIRKKKKPPAHNAADNPLSVNNIIKKRLAAMENLENKDETDISKEIKGWVLNKGVGESVLHKASRLGYVDVIAYCLERINMSPDPKDNAGYTPLHEACSKGHLDIARLLLQFGANHSETAQSGIRPLHEAVENGYIEIVRLLLSYGADPCLATYSGQTPIMLSENENMTQFLRSYLIDVDNIPGTKVNWKFDESFSVYDPDELGYEIFEDIPVKKISFGSSMVSVLSTSTTSLITATTQMSDNETITSETMSTPIKVPVTPAKMNFETKIPTPIQPAQDLMKFQHKMKKCDTNSNNIVMANPLEDKMNNNSQDVKKVTKKGANTKSCSVVMNNIDSLKKIKKLPAISKQESPPVVVKIQEPIRKLEEIKHKDDYDDMVDENHLESDNELLEIEESEAPLPPLYLLKDEGSEKWILLTDLCNLLKVKSKDAVLKQICPSSPPAMNKELLRELKMSDFLEKAICLQLFCAGEKLNIRSSKVILVRYNDSVRNLLGVSTIRMNM